MAAFLQAAVEVVKAPKQLLITFSCFLFRTKNTSSPVHNLLARRGIKADFGIAQ